MYMKNQRSRYILQELDKMGSVKVNRLSEELKCCELTIRRTLQGLEQEGLLKRVHGGAIKVGNNFVKNQIKETIYSNTYEKMEIARYAYGLLKDGDTILLDDASTCMYVAGIIKNEKGKRLKIVTNSILIAMELLEVDTVALVMLGGEIAKNLAATEGITTLSCLEGLKIDKAFIGVNGVDTQRGITVIGYPQKLLKMKVMEISKEIYILADSSKFEKAYLSELCGIDEVTGIITSSVGRKKYCEGEKWEKLVITSDEKKRNSFSGNVR